MNFYGLFLTSALAVGFYLTAHRATKRGLNPDLVWQSLPWVIGFGLLGARLYHVLNFLPFYLQNPVLIPQVWLGGLGIWGGVFGGILGVLIFEKFDRARPSSTTLLHSNVVKGEGQMAKYLDAASPGIALGQAIGRVGNILNNENLPYAYWEVITNFWIVIFLLLVEKLVSSKNVFFTIRAYPESQKSIDKLLDASGEARRTRRIIKPGYLFFLYLFSYSVTRFFLEFFRKDSPWVLGPLTMAQWISVAVLGVVIVLFSKSCTNRSGKAATARPDFGSRA